MADSKSFTKNLAKIRKQKGLSQKDLAKKSGISARMIAHYETHVSYPSIEKIDIIAKALDVNMGELLGIEKTVNEIYDNELDVRTIKRFKRLLRLNPQDRSNIYKMIDLLLQKPEYQEKLKQTES